MNYLIEKQLLLAMGLGATRQQQKSSLKEHVRPVYRRVRKKLYDIRYGRIHAKLPDFLIIGQQKCGTSSLHHYLSLHPDVSCPEKKEIHFFDYNYDYGIPYYKSYFSQLADQDGQFLTGEATPEYIFHPYSAARISESLPNVKAIVLLRSPVERAFSAWRMGVRQGWEDLSFESAIQLEGERIVPDLMKLAEDEFYYGYDWSHYSYLTRGAYIFQIENWFRHFKDDQLSILSSERFFNNTRAEFKRVCDFLELNEWYPKEFKNMFVGLTGDLNGKVRKKIDAFFTPYNQRLYEHINEDLGW